MRLSRLLVIGLMAALLGAAAAAGAAEISVSRNEAGESHVFISGKLEREDARIFTEAVISSKADLVFLASPGGSIEAAIEIGRVIRLKGLSTIVMDNDYCASACGLIWLAGARRILTQGARVGFHATYTTRDNVRLESGVGNALVGRYLTLLNLPERAIIFATVAGPERLNWLDAGNRRASGIELEAVESSGGNRTALAAAVRLPAATISGFKTEAEHISLQD